jgi:hypothetical protein
MDRYFYSVELNCDGNKVIHMSGNIYWNDVDTSETDYRCAEWTFFYISLNELKELVENGWFYEYVNERVNYLGDITKAEALEACVRYFNGKPGVYLHIEDVNEETPCGDYWFEA